ncbi:hypothetical protein [Sphingomonas sp.]|uniref:Uncharacterized protein n=1 Tax=Variovorax paradoxus TaxID=34073 RepID=A0A2W5S9T4_VARPD|nr:hypothetical protein [Sphingomonas sp.]PZQ76393.1 MAG: hypothetical protein DI563_07130 [Variovorax paradoxus]
MRRLSPTELDTLRRLGLLDLYDKFQPMFDGLFDQSRHAVATGPGHPAARDVVDDLKVWVHANPRFLEALKKRRHTPQGYYENYAELLARYIVAKNGNKTYIDP